MITYQLFYPKKCREDLKNLDKLYAQKLPNSYLRMSGKSLCFKFDNEQGKMLFMEAIKNAIDMYSKAPYDFYKDYAVIREK